MESLNASSDDESNDWLSKAIELLSGHLVGLTWYEGLKTDKGYREKPTWQAASAFIVEILGGYWLATAAHVFAGVETKREQNSNFTIDRCRVWDAWHIEGEAAKHPIDYDIFSDELTRFTLYDLEKGFDLTLIQIPLYLANFLGKTILPFRRIDWTDSDTREYLTHCIVGLPTCLAEEEVVPKGKKKEIRNTFSPFVVPVNSIASSNVAATDFPQFVARIHHDFPIESVVGMSGGIIVGFTREDGGQVQRWPVAIQSRWLRKKRIVIGTYLAPCLAAIESKYGNQDKP
jgi:hypothetical protein